MSSSASPRAVSSFLMTGPVVLADRKLLDVRRAVDERARVNGKELRLLGLIVQMLDLVNPDRVDDEGRSHVVRSSGPLRGADARRFLWGDAGHGERTGLIGSAVDEVDFRVVSAPEARRVAAADGGMRRWACVATPRGPDGHAHHVVRLPGGELLIGSTDAPLGPPDAPTGAGELAAQVVLGAEASTDVESLAWWTRAALERSPDDADGSLVDWADGDAMDALFRRALASVRAEIGHSSERRAVPAIVVEPEPYGVTVASGEWVPWLMWYEPREHTLHVGDGSARLLEQGAGGRHLRRERVTYLLLLHEATHVVDISERMSAERLRDVSGPRGGLLLAALLEAHADLIAERVARREGLASEWVWLERWRHARGMAPDQAGAYTGDTDVIERARRLVAEQLAKRGQTGVLELFRDASGTHRDR